MRPTPRDDILVWADAGQDGGSGRFGHAFKTAGSALILAELFGWRALRPQNFKHLHTVFDESRLGPSPRCPSGYVTKILAPRASASARFEGAVWWATLCAQVSDVVHPGQGRVCIVLRGNFRVQLHRVFGWESKQLVHKGAYSHLAALFRAAVRTRKHGHWSPTSPAVTIVVHLRRGDVAARERKKSETSYTLAARARDAISSAKVMIFLLTEPRATRHSADVFDTGCSSVRAASSAWANGIRPAHTTCRVISSNVERDFAAMLSADVLVLSNSGFSTTAALLRDKKGLVVSPPGIKHFFRCPSAGTQEPTPLSFVCPFVLPQSNAKENHSRGRMRAASAVFDGEVLSKRVSTWWLASNSSRRIKQGVKSKQHGGVTADA